MNLTIPYDDCIAQGPFYWGRVLSAFEDEAGVHKTVAGKLRMWDDRPNRTYHAEVRFDSRAWTGR